MIEIKNKNKFPVSLPIRSRRSPRRLAILTVPGIGCGKNVKFLEEELMTDFVVRAKNEGIIHTRTIDKRELNKGE